MNHYESKIKKQMVKVIGSIEILGNPLGFINQIKSGVIDMID